MTSRTTQGPPQQLDELLHQLTDIIRQHGDAIAEENPMSAVLNQFLENSWQNCLNGLLKKTSKIRIRPHSRVAPSGFDFEIDCPYKRLNAQESSVELAPGPVRGKIFYRLNILTSSKAPPMAVLLDRELGYFHPNYEPVKSILCYGAVPGVPLDLDHFLENFLYPVVTYQNRSPADSADEKAARYFAFNPEAMEGLEPVEPLY